MVFHVLLLSITFVPNRAILTPYHCNLNIYKIQISILEIVSLINELFNDTIFVQEKENSFKIQKTLSILSLPLELRVKMLNRITYKSFLNFHDFYWGV